MTTIRKFCLDDLLYFASVNLDHLTTTERIFHYQTLLTKWSDYCHVAVGPGNRIIGYLIGLTEERLPDGDKGQVITVSVDSEYRRQGVGTRLMEKFEKQLVELLRPLPTAHPYYVFLYVGVFNTPAKRFFREIGYKTVATLPKFFPKNDDEDAHKMRKELEEEIPPAV